MNIRKGIIDYLVRISLKGQSEQTLKNVEFHLTKFQTWLIKSYNLDDSRVLRAFHIKAYQKHLGIKCNYQPSYINQRVIAVNSFLKYLKKENEAIELSLESVKEPKKLPQVISIEQYDEIRNTVATGDKIDLRNYAVITLFMSSGIRVGAMSKLKVSDVNLDERTLHVTGKGKKERLAVFGEQCRDVLSNYLASVRPRFRGANSCDALFISRNASFVSIRSYQDIFNRAARAAGITEKVTPHTFRRTFCTELIKAEANLYHVANMMGHESLEHLKSYARLNIKPLKKTHERCHPRG